MALGPNQYAGIAEGAIGLTAATGGAIYGAIKSGKLNRQAQKILQQQKKDNQEWYNIKMSQDYTQRADVQAAINKQRELLNEQYDKARATNVVTGGTDESLALQKQAANRSLSDTAAAVAARGADYKDSIERQYMSRKAGLEDMERMKLEQRAAATAQASSQVVNQGLNLVGDSFKTFRGDTGGSSGGGTMMQGGGGSNLSAEQIAAIAQAAQSSGGK